MIGCFLLSGFVALGVAKFAFHRRMRLLYGGGGCGGGGWAHGGWHGGFHHHVRRHHFDDGMTFGRGFSRGDTPPFLWSVLDRLAVTPAQERAVRSAFDELREELRGLRGESERTRSDLASALRRPSFDEVMMGDVFARHDTALEHARKAFVGFFAKVHDALDEEQRKRLADLIDRGGRFGWW